MFTRHLSETKEAEKQFWTEELKDLRAPNFPQVPSSDYTPHPSATLTKARFHWHLPLLPKD